MMNERHFNIGDIVRIPVARVKERIKRISQVSSIPFNEIVYSEDPLDQYVKARIIEYNDKKKNKSYDVCLLDKNRRSWLTIYYFADEEMYICEDDQPNHFVSKFKPGDRVVVRVSYFKDHCLETPLSLNRYGTISGIKYETGPYDSIGANVSYNVKMDNGIDLVINDPIYLLYDHSTNLKFPKFELPLNYDLLNTYTKDLISDTINKAKEFNIKKEKQMDNALIYRVIFNDPATIILWNTFHFEDKECEINGEKGYKRILVRDKTVVKCAKGEKFNKYNGFCAAVAKRAFETNSAIHRIIENATDNSDSNKLLKEIEKTGKKVKAQRENMKETKKK